MIGRDGRPWKAAVDLDLQRQVPDAAPLQIRPASCFAGRRRAFWCRFFGVRGLNSGLDDAGKPGVGSWRLCSRAAQGTGLLDSLFERNVCIAAPRKI